MAKKPTKSTNSNRLPAELVWLADAPLFIDANQVARFYDAVVRPESAEGTTTLSVTKDHMTRMGAALGIKASVTPSGLANLLTPVFAFIKPKLEVEGKVDGEQKATKGKQLTINMHPIDTPQRQLEQLTLHYLVNHPERLFLVNDPAKTQWRDDDAIQEVPRALAFLDLPGELKADQAGSPKTKLIPMAAEFDNGAIEPLYNKLQRANGERPPKYPEHANSIADLRKLRKKYWQWFDQHFSATQAMRIVEEAARLHHRLRWIDYRIPLTNDGDTLHLHVCPAGSYDTGVFAYNLIKRGYKHGLRLIGTLKSEPDMNVLAVYEK